MSSSPGAQIVEGASVRLKTKIPITLTALRVFLAPVVIMLAINWPIKVAFGFCLVLAFLSDVFDGILARRLNIATPNHRRLDSIEVAPQSWTGFWFS